MKTGKPSAERGWRNVSICQSNTIYRSRSEQKDHFKCNPELLSGLCHVSIRGSGSRNDNAGEYGPDVGSEYLEDTGAAVARFWSAYHGGNMAIRIWKDDRTEKFPAGRGRRQCGSMRRFFLGIHGYEADAPHKTGRADGADVCDGAPAGDGI